MVEREGVAGRSARLPARRAIELPVRSKRAPCYGLACAAHGSACGMGAMTRLMSELLLHSGDRQAMCVCVWGPSVRAMYARGGFAWREAWEASSRRTKRSAAPPRDQTSRLMRID